MKEVVVYGDPIIDKFVVVDRLRVQSESPAQIGNVKETYLSLGGALSVAEHAQRMASGMREDINVTLRAAARLQTDSLSLGLKIEALMRNADLTVLYGSKKRTYQWPIKTRYIDATGKILFRVDDEKIVHMQPAKPESFKNHGEVSYVISDYDKGYFNGFRESFIDSLNGEVIVNGRPKYIKHYIEADFIIFNEHEWREVYSMLPMTSTLLDVKDALSLEFGACPAQLIKTGSETIEYIGDHGGLVVQHIEPKKDFYPVGAGDSFAAAFAVSSGTTASRINSAHKYASENGSMGFWKTRKFISV